MSFQVECPHCEAILAVPEKFHYKTITCPDCAGELEAVTTETMRVTREFIEQLEGDADDEVGISSLPRPGSRATQSVGEEPSS